MGAFDSPSINKLISGHSCDVPNPTTLEHRHFANLYRGCRLKTEPHSASLNEVRAHTLPRNLLYTCERSFSAERLNRVGRIFTRFACVGVGEALVASAYTGFGGISAFYPSHNKKLSVESFPILASTNDSQPNTHVIVNSS